MRLSYEGLQAYPLQEPERRRFERSWHICGVDALTVIFQSLGSSLTKFTKTMDK
jgi:hypothetical protein